MGSALYLLSRERSDCCLTSMRVVEPVTGPARCPNPGGEAPGNGGGEARTRSGAPGEPELPVGESARALEDDADAVSQQRQRVAVEQGL